MKKQKKSKPAKSAKKAIVKTAPKSEPKTVPVPQVEVEVKDTGVKIKPLGDRVLVRPSLATETEKKNDFGIIIPDTVEKERPEQGEILAVGEGKYEGGKLVPIKVKVGDRVIFSKYAFEEVKMGEENLYILKEENILAVIKK
jgi:chaperonin GroES